jgi:hypothetical protein
MRWGQAAVGGGARLEVVRSTLLIALLGSVTLSCSGGDLSIPLPGSRTYRMGFSAIPARADSASLIENLEMWTERADAAIMHVSPPWAALIAGIPADTAVTRNELGLANYYRSKGLEIVVMVDVTDGLDRSAEAPELEALERSITEPEIQALYRNYVLAMDRIVSPGYLGLAAETNLIRGVAPSPLYAAVVQMTNDAALALRQAHSTVQIYVSVQVEVVWGALQGGNYAGIEQDLSDFPFIQAVGLSSYAYLGGFEDPEELPIDYYSRVTDGTSLPELVVEGGWTSTSVAGVTSSPEEQARWTRRHFELLDHAKARAVFQLTFTDLDLSSFPPSVLPFAYLGLVDTELRPKPALAVWDSVFSRDWRAPQ